MPKRRREKRSKSVRKRGRRASSGKRQSQNIRIQIQSAPGAAGGGGGGGSSSSAAPPAQYMPQPYFPVSRGRERGGRDVVRGSRESSRGPVPTMAAMPASTPLRDTPMAPPPMAPAPLSENAVPADVLQAPNIMQSDPVHPEEVKENVAQRAPARVKLGRIQLSRSVYRRGEPSLLNRSEAPSAALAIRPPAPLESGAIAPRQDIPQSGIMPGSIWSRFSKEEFEKRIADAWRRTDNRRRGAYLPPASRSPVVEEPPSPVVPIPPAMRASIVQPASFRVPPLSGETAEAIRAAVAEQARLEAIKEEMGVPSDAPVASVAVPQLMMVPHTTQEIEPAVIPGGARAKPSLARRHEQRRLERRLEKFEQKREARKAAERAAEEPSSTIIAGGPTFQFSEGGASLKEEAAPSSVAPLVPEAAAEMGVGQQPPPLRSIPFLAQPLVYEPPKEPVTTKRPDRGGDYDYQGPRPASVAFPKEEREAVETVPKVFKVGQGGAEPGSIPLVGPVAGFQGRRTTFMDNE